MVSLNRKAFPTKRNATGEARKVFIPLEFDEPPFDPFYFVFVDRNIKEIGNG